MNLEAIQKRRAKITQGPWRHHREGIISNVLATAHGFDDILIAEVAQAFSNNHDDAEFIAHAPQDIDDLLCRIKELEHELSE